MQKTVLKLESQEKTMKIIDLIYKEEKFSLYYLLQAIGAEKYRFGNCDSIYKKDQLRHDLIMIAISNPNKFDQFTTYKKHIN